MEERDGVAEAVRVALTGLPATDDARRWLPLAVSRIVERFDPLRVVLFGSQAVGLPRPDSDVDILVEKPDGSDRRELALAIASALRDLPIAKDILVTTSPQRPAPGTAIEAALRDGKVLYERRAESPPDSRS